MRHRILLAVGITAGILATGCGASAAAAAPVARSAALAALEALPIKAPLGLGGYSRAAFGQQWKDTDRNGCGQRDDVLSRDLTAVQRRGRCVVTAGTLVDPYTGATIKFTRGQTTSSAVQIDHVVALAASWQTGAQLLSPTHREQLANDFLELLAVDGRTNQAKGDSDAANWLPPNAACPYVARQIAIKTRYSLWITPAEHAAMARVLASCPGQALPSS